MSRSTLGPAIFAIAAVALGALALGTGKTHLWVAWPMFATLLVCFGVYLGVAIEKGPFGLLLDERERYSLARLQLVTWTVVVISLLAAVALLRIIGGQGDALAITIADELLIVTGISLGSSAVASAVKSNQDTNHAAQVAVGHPKWTQLFLVEAGTGADEAIDVPKFQNVLITLIVVVAYCVYVLRTIGGKGAEIDALPGFSTTVLTLVAVSHAGYLAGKLVPPVGQPSPEVETIAERNEQLESARDDAEKTRRAARSAGVKP